MSQSNALKKRIAPSVPLKLELEDDTGAKFARDFKLSFDFNAAALIEEKTGLNLLTAEVWSKGLSARSLAVMLWASVIANHPEYQTVDDDGEANDDGLETIRSYMDVGNTDQIFEALWNAYFISLPKDKREALEQARKELTAKKESGITPQTVAPQEPAATTNPSDGSNSGQSPDTILDSTSTSSAA